MNSLRLHLPLHTALVATLCLASARTSAADEPQDTGRFTPLPGFKVEEVVKPGLDRFAGDHGL